MSLGAFLQAARAAVASTVAYARITLVHDLNDYSVQVPGHVDSRGREVPMRLRSLANVPHVVGEQVVIAWTNYAEATCPPMWVILDATTRRTSKIVAAQVWSVHRADAQRTGAQRMLTSPMALAVAPLPMDGHNAVVARASKTTLLIATDAQLRQFKRDGTEIEWDNSLTPDFTIFDITTGRFYIADSGTLSMISPGTTTLLTGSDLGNIDLEPVFVETETTRRLWVFDTSDTLDWLMRSIDTEDLATVHDSVPVPWDGYDHSAQAPHSVIPEVGEPSSFPIFFYNAPTDQLLFSTYRSKANLVVDQLMVPQSNDQDWRDAASAELADPRHYERSRPHSYARLTDRPQLRCLTLDPLNLGDDKWILDGATGDADWQSFQPVAITTTHLLAHSSQVTFSPFTFKHVAYNADTETAAARLAAGLDDAHAFFGVPYWNPTSNVPPWYWRTSWYESRKNAVLDTLAPSWSAEVTRDAQSVCAHKLITVELETGQTVATVDLRGPNHCQATDNTHWPDGPEHDTAWARQYFDTGDAACSLHSDSISALPPRLMFDGSARKVAASTSDPDATSLRAIFGLRDDEFVASFVAVEQFTGDAWNGWSSSYWFAYDVGFDSRHDATPIYRYDETVGHSVYVETRPAPFTWEITDEFGTHDLWPYPSTYAPAGNLTVTTDTVAGLTTFYCGHVGYRVNPDGTFDDTAVQFTYDIDEDLHRDSHVTTSVTYLAWVVRASYAKCSVPNLNMGWDPHNALLDGSNALFLPRCLDTYTGDWPGIAHTYPQATTTTPHADDELEDAPSTQVRYVPPARSQATIRCMSLPSLEVVWETSPQLDDGSYIEVHRTPAAAVLAYDTGPGILLMLLENHLYRVNCTDGSIVERVDFPGSDWSSAEIVVVDATAYIATDVGTWAVPV